MEIFKVKMFGYFLNCLAMLVVLPEEGWGIVDFLILLNFVIDSIGVIINFVNNKESVNIAWKSGEIKSRFEYLKKLFFNYQIIDNR